MSFWSSAGGGAAIGAAAQGIGMLGGAGMSRKGYHRQKKLMGFQKDHQMDLNRHGQELAMDMWNKTNYGAQMKHMRDAGLNPALMYGSAGQGGSTNAGSGGSAQSGQAPQERVMDMSNMLLGAQIKNLNKDVDVKDAQIEDIQSQIDKRGGYEKDESVSKTALNIVDKDLKSAGIVLTERQTEKVNAEIEKIKVDTEMADKIIKLDYSGDYGKNLFENTKKALGLTPDKDGALGLDDAVKIAFTVGGLGLLRNPKTAAKLAKPLAQNLSKATGSIISKVMQWYRKVKK